MFEFTHYSAERAFDSSSRLRFLLISGSLSRIVQSELPATGRASFGKAFLSKAQKGGVTTSLNNGLRLEKMPYKYQSSRGLKCYALTRNQSYLEEITILCLSHILVIIPVSKSISKHQLLISWMIKLEEKTN